MISPEPHMLGGGGRTQSGHSVGWIPYVVVVDAEG